MNDLSVHPDSFSVFFIWTALPSDGIQACGAFGEMPFMLCEARVIFGIDDCEFAAGEGNFAEGISEADSAV